MRDVAVNCVRSKDAQKQLARTSLSNCEKHKRLTRNAVEWVTQQPKGKCKYYHYSSYLGGGVGVDLSQRCMRSRSGRGLGSGLQSNLWTQ